MHTPIRAVLFDLDRTLVDLEGATRHGILAHLDALGLPAGDDEYLRWKEYEDVYIGRYMAAELGFQEQRRCRARAMSRMADLSDADADIWFNGFYSRMTAALKAFADVEPTLDALAEVGVTLGIVTNMISAYQLEKLHQCHIDPGRFACFLGLEELPAAKPHPDAFLTACSTIGVEPHEALYVGDEPITDAAAAREAGLRSIWLDRTERLATLPEDVHVRLDGVEICSDLMSIPARLSA
ncbi:putative hydrolase of the HAD superfamily [Catenulispora sp. GAS73]|uniref:HAD family hydrolase n=1 Tax=Catenulispora sp. GAS73 TaxID=3156269 RepID=UPI0035158A83